jgi:acyl carrier protein
MIGSPTPDEVLAVVRAAVATVLEVDAAGVGAGSRFREDLDADSLALVEIVEIVEEQLARRSPGFAVDDDELDGLRTVGEAVDLALSRLGGSR